jgi:hypothetical protein
LYSWSRVRRLALGDRRECRDLRLIEHRRRWRGRLGRLGSSLRLRRRTQRRLLAADDPAGDEPEQNPGNAECDGFGLH